MPTKSASAKWWALGKKPRLANHLCPNLFLLGRPWMRCPACITPVQSQTASHLQHSNLRFGARANTGTTGMRIRKSSLPQDTRGRRTRSAWETSCRQLALAANGHETTSVPISDCPDVRRRPRPLHSRIPFACHVSNHYGSNLNLQDALHMRSVAPKWIARGVCSPQIGHQALSTRRRGWAQHTGRM